MKSAKAVPKKTSSKSSKKTELDETKCDNIKEKLYITKEIETSITLLESPESSVVLEALLFLSKYADIQRNNLSLVQSRGLLPKLLALLDHNICILKVSLRLLSQLLTVDAAKLELNQEIFDEAVLKICQFFVNHDDANVREFASLILTTYAQMGKSEVLLKEPKLLTTILKEIKSGENDSVLGCCLELFSKFLESEAVRKDLPSDGNFNLADFVTLMTRSERWLKQILKIFEKMTYFGDDVLQKMLKECSLVEHVFDVIIDPNMSEQVLTCLNIVNHCMSNENTNSYFVQSLEFLKFCLWAKTCADDAMLSCARIFLELSKIDFVRQVLFDLSVENVIVSFLRSNDKEVLNTTCDAISWMSKHKYCCEAMVIPFVIKKILQMLERSGDSLDPYNETALTTLHCFCRRDSRTIHMIRSYDGVNLLAKHLKQGTDKLEEFSFRKVLEIVNMFVTNNQLRSCILSPDLYDAILTQTQSKFDEICMRSLEIMINCLNQTDFQDYFLLKEGSKIIANKLSITTNEKTIRMLVIFIHNALMYDKLATDLILAKTLLALKNIPEGVKYRNPLIQRTVNLIYNHHFPTKFYETGRLDFGDKINDTTFYVILGPWEGAFPFLEVLELRQMSTKNTMYVVNSLKGTTTSAIHYGKLSQDPYLPKYISQVHKLLTGIKKLPNKVKVLAEFVDGCLCGPSENCTIPEKLHSFRLHIACIKEKLGTNMIPVGYLRLGFHCEKALLFKALADHVCLPTTLVKGKHKLYWNEIAEMEEQGNRIVLKMFVVDLMNNIGQLLPIGSRECNAYCDIQ